MWPLALARRRHTAHSAMCLHTHKRTYKHIHVRQQSWTFIHNIIHINSKAPKCIHTQTCIVHTVFGPETPRACSQANIEQRPGSILTCGCLYLKIIRGKRGLNSVLFFITWHVYLCVCPLLGRTIYWEKTGTNSCTSPCCFTIMKSLHIHSP